jgi:hypothetical protein
MILQGKFFLTSALVLNEVVIVIVSAGCTSMADFRSKVRPLGSMKRASAGSSIRVFVRSKPEGDNMQSFKRSSDFSLVKLSQSKSIVIICFLCEKSFSKSL